MADQLSEDLKSLTIAREAKPESGALRWIVGLALLAGAGALATFVGYPYLASRLWKTEVAVTEIMMVSPSAASTELSSTGYVQPLTTAKVSSQIASRIMKVLVKEGDVVIAGQPLVELDAAQLRSALQAANARVSSARARVDTARAQWNEAKIMAEREKSLVERGVSGKANLEDLQARAGSLAEQVKATQSEVSATQAEVAARRVDLDYVIVKAPIAGTVVTKPLGVGEMVSPLMTPSQPILEISDLTTLVVETDVPENRLSMVHIGRDAEIILDAYPSERMPGEVLEISKKVDRAKASVLVRVKFKQVDARVLPDMAARVSFLTEGTKAEVTADPPRPVVPTAAVVDRNGQKVVFVVEDGIARQVAVTVGAPFGGGLELKQGPAAGTRIVAEPKANLRDGQKIKEKSQ